MSCPTTMFHDALQSLFGPLDWLPIPDGAIHRFHVPGDKPGSRNGWYVLYLDGIASGAFGSWKAGIPQTWSSRKPVNRLEAHLIAKHIERAKQQRETDLSRRRLVAADRARLIWEAAQSAHPNHRYLTRKRIKPHRLRLSGDALLVPLYAGSVLVNLQRIYPDGTKRFLPGGRVKGCYSFIDDPRPKQPLYLCEGWATGASIHADTGYAVACAMNASNLLAVGHELQHLYPDSQLIIAADDDRESETQGKGNPGIEAATNAAIVLGCGLVLPEFPVDAPLALSDFNDLANWEAAQCA